MSDLIRRQDAILALLEKGQRSRRYKLGEIWELNFDEIREALATVPSAEPEEVTPHRNYKYLSDYWCECGWHLGKKGEVKYCSECGRKVNWDE